MKKLFLLLIAFALLLSCEDRDQDSTVLPEATQTGANTGGALVDGNIWVAKIEQPDLNPGGNNTIYSYNNVEYRLEIVLRSVKNPSANQISFIISIPQDITAGNYQFFGLDENRAVYYLSPTSYFTETGNPNGNVTITKLDNVNKIVSGTFNFVGKKSNGETVTITEGRFDKKFIN